MKKSIYLKYLVFLLQFYLWNCEGINDFSKENDNFIAEPLQTKPNLRTTIIPNKVSMKWFYKTIDDSNNLQAGYVVAESGYIILGGSVSANAKYKMGYPQFIIKSRPHPSYLQWRGSSFTEFPPDGSHKTTIIGNGIKIEGISSIEIIKNLKFYEITSPQMNQPYAEVIIDSDYQLLSGGARANENFIALTASIFNTKKNGWIAESMKLPDSKKGTVTAFAIGIRKDFIRAKNISIEYYFDEELKNHETTLGGINLDIRNREKQHILICFGGREVTYGNVRRGISRLKQETEISASVNSHPYIDVNTYGRGQICGIGLRVE